MSYTTIFNKTAFASAVCSLFALGLIGSGLFTNHLFLYSSFFPYFLFITIALVTLFYSGFLMAVTAKRDFFRFGISSLIFLFWAVYVLGHGMLSVLTYRSWYIIACFLAYLALILQVGNLKPVYIFRGIALLVFIEVLFCLLQALGVLSSPDSNFRVTGTWINPNVSAMFLSMCFPALFVLIADAKGIAWKALGMLIVLTVVSLLLLKCRSAFMGAGIASALLLNRRFQLLPKFFKASSSVKSSLVFLFFFTVFTIGSAFYYAKEGSSSGRKLVWRLSLELFCKKPLTGFGYGLFDREYNLQQAGYFAKGQAAYEEQIRADFVQTAYNEFLENSVEGGLPGLLIFSGLLFFLLYASGSDPDPNTENSEREYSAAAQAGIAAFALMSLVNFTIEAIPVMALFILYAAITGRVKRRELVGGLELQFTPVWVKTAGAAICLLAIFMLAQVSQIAYAQRQARKAFLLIEDERHKEALKLLKSYEQVLANSEGYLRTTAKALYKQQRYKEALAKYNEAKFFSSSPELYKEAAVCCKYIRDFSAAEQNLLTALYIDPKIFYTRMALLDLYLQTGNKDAAAFMAHNIISLNPKIPSSKVRRYKAQARSVLNYLNQE